MKKTILVLLALTLVCALAGCRGGNATNTTGAATTATQSTTTVTTQSTTAATEMTTDMTTAPTMDNGNGPLTTDPVTGTTNTEGTSGSATGTNP